MRLLKVARTIFMRVDYVFDLCFLECKIQPISMIFGILNKQQWNFKKMLFIFF